jgi:pseudouridine synthase
MRLQKFMAMAGVASRRQSEKLIEEGKVKVNGHVVKEMGTKIDEKRDTIHVQGKRVFINEDKLYYMLNKPRGYVSTVNDEKNRKTIMELVPDEERLYPVGRLDQNTSGILLLTNDGDLTYRLTHPKHEVTKKYVIKVKPIPSKEKLSELRKGGDIGVYTIASCEIRLRRFDEEENTGTYEVTISEGKNRQVRNMFEYIGCEVVTLKRIAIGELTLKGLRLGKSRKLTPEEIIYVKKLAGI